MDSMDIAALSTTMSQMSVAAQVSTSVLSMALDTQDVTSDSMIKMMETSVQPNLGANIDVRI